MEGRLRNPKLDIDVTWSVDKLTEYHKNELIAFAIRTRLGDTIAGCRTKTEAEKRLSETAQDYGITINGLGK